ncbi:GNAT family N-acetyltransferase [Lichenifustis flavocetrariae]|uniref:GNAT family N-acetyltransferase n=1 Tax=Lichenifustis flavocetrariae TaxID=2949735 RepID=A0AA41Z0J0_9HYPH|nr:GNAT family N-acetyltransferase [Lichenifustis flavocetrariae]MCW6508230.1 GNAT family N-acetyltransferase [Lichenifustis flavocetrariae]
MPAPALTIRPPGQNDRDAWEKLWKGYQTFYEVDLPPAVTAETWRRIHDPTEPVWAALAWSGDLAVGLVHWLFHRSTWMIEDYCYLQDLFVAPEIRGGGVGRRLIAHVHDAALGGGAGRLYWLTHETNTQAMTLYDAIGSKSGFLQYRMPL